MHYSLLRLCCKNMRAAHSKPIGVRCTFLEDMSLSGQWLVLVEKNASVLRDTSIWFGRRGYGGDEVLGEHSGDLERVGA
jgi:hypothetical protein